MARSLDILVDGSRSAELSRRWRSLTVIDGINYQDDSATLVISVPAPLAIVLPPLSAELRFAVDGLNLSYPLRATAIRGDSRAGSVTVEAAAADPRSPLNDVRTASWSGQSIGAIATAIAERAGLVPAISPALADVVPGGVMQSDESDKVFLMRLADQFGWRFDTKGGRLTVLAVGGGTSAAGAPLPAVEIDLRASGAWVRWRRSEAAIVDIAETRFLQDDGATPEYVALGEAPEGKRPKRRKVPGLFATRADAEAKLRRVLANGRSGFDYIEIQTSLMPEARAYYPVSLSGAPEGFPTRLIIQQVRHELGRRVATTTITARP